MIVNKYIFIGVIFLVNLAWLKWGWGEEDLFELLSIDGFLIGLFVFPILRLISIIGFCIINNVPLGWALEYTEFFMDALVYYILIIGIIGLVKSED